MQAELFNKEDLNKWKEEWKDMPEFIQEDLMPSFTLMVHFENDEDRKDFSDLVKQKITSKTKSIWFPEAKKDIVFNKIYISES